MLWTTHVRVFDLGAAHFADEVFGHLLYPFLAL